MRSPYTLGIVAALVLVLAAGGAWYVLTQQQSLIEFVPAVANPRDSGATILLTTSSHKRISVPDFTFGHPRVDLDKTDITLVLLSQTTDGVEEDPRYGIVFSSDGTFTIGLFKEPLREARIAAEQRLREFVEVSDDILCDLPITVAVPDTIQPRYAGRDVGLSFCSGALSL